MKVVQGVKLTQKSINERVKQLVHNDCPLTTEEKSWLLAAFQAGHLGFMFRGATDVTITKDDDWDYHPVFLFHYEDARQEKHSWKKVYKTKHQYITDRLREVVNDDIYTTRRRNFATPNLLEIHHVKPFAQLAKEWIANVGGEEAALKICMDRDAPQLKQFRSTHDQTHTEILTLREHRDLHV